MSTNVALAIDQAFAAVPAPDADELRISTDDESFEDIEAFRGKRWQEIDAAQLASHQNALFWFSPTAFHYYLPAFLKAGLAAPDAIFVITLLQLLTPSPKENLNRFRELRWSQLGPQQIAVLDQWLGTIAETARPGGVFAQEIAEAQKAVRERRWW
ncbi:MAG TPA: DUF6714 family protein [Pirellulales bacterium]|jgi:hypothetical protein|nr:DUF6714 family protein [Pirellulales bacterium]